MSCVLEGLATAPQKRLPSKLFYDSRGSQLFDLICDLPEYYLTRTEIGILRDFASDITSHVGPRTALVEYGANSAKKIGFLLDLLPEMAAYVPVDISRDHLLRASAELAASYPRVAIVPLYADYSKPLVLPTVEGADSRTGFFPGVTDRHITVHPSLLPFASLVSHP
jgi:uncharacterized SAM-dependent methyltransferase